MLQKYWVVQHCGIFHQVGLPFFIPLWEGATSLWKEESSNVLNIVTTPTQPQHNLNLTQLSWVWHDYCCSPPHRELYFHRMQHQINLWCCLNNNINIKDNNNSKNNDNNDKNSNNNNNNNKNNSNNNNKTTSKQLGNNINIKDNNNNKNNKTISKQL